MVSANDKGKKPKEDDPHKPKEEEILVGDEEYIEEYNTDVYRRETSTSYPLSTITSSKYQETLPHSYTSASI